MRGLRSSPTSACDTRRSFRFGSTPNLAVPGSDGKRKPSDESLGFRVAGWTGLEPAASGVTGRRYNRLNYRPKNRTAATYYIHMRGRLSIPSRPGRRDRA